MCRKRVREAIKKKDLIWCREEGHSLGRPSRRNINDVYGVSSHPNRRPTRLISIATSRSLSRRCQPRTRLPNTQSRRTNGLWNAHTRKACSISGSMHGSERGDKCAESREGCQEFQPPKHPKSRITPTTCATAPTVPTKMLPIAQKHKPELGLLVSRL
jgi:hypothetical protein